MNFKRLAVVTAAAGIVATLIAKRRLHLTSVDFESTSNDRPLDDGSSYVEIDGLRVRTLVRGSGEPAIVLLHGFAASVFTWLDVIDELAERGRVIAFDRPAYGFTSRPTRASWQERSPYSMEANVDLTVGLLDHFDVDRAVLIGHSAGGTIAALTAIAHPDRIQSLVLVAPAIYVDVPPPEWLHRVVDSGLMRRVGPHVAHVIARRTESIMRRAWHDPSRITPDVVEGYLAPFRASGWGAGMWEVVRANRRTHLGSRIERLSVPTLMITGDHDRVVPTRQTVRAAHAIPGAELEVISECGHIPQEEQPERFLEIVTRFIRSQTKLNE